MFFRLKKSRFLGKFIARIAYRQTKTVQVVRRSKPFNEAKI
jgi:hypothetical protein